jgi:hypothetical protein
MLTNAVRNFVALVLWLVLVLVSLYVNVQVTIANYLGCKAALELQGYESQPLSSDSLVGRLLGSLFGDATLAQFFALGVAIIEALGLFLIFNIGFGLSKLFEIRRENRRALEEAETTPIAEGHDPAAEVRASSHRIVLSYVKLACLGVMLFFAINWDLDLFRFRSVADALANGSPEITPMQIPSWVNFVSTNDHLFVKGLISIGAWGYLAITAIGCFLLEESFENLSERWARLMAPADQAIADWFSDETSGPETLYGYDAAEQPVYDAQTPIAFDTDGNAVIDDRASDRAERFADDEVTVVSARRSPVPHDQDGVADTVVPEARPAETARTSHQASPLFDFPQAEPPAPNNAGLHAVPDGLVTADLQLRDVIGAYSERVSLSVAQADPGRYYVDRDGRIWSRTHWEELNGVLDQGPLEPEAKAA